jgi:hypothetical protein
MIRRSGDLDEREIWRCDNPKEEVEQKKRKKKEKEVAGRYNDIVDEE